MEIPFNLLPQNRNSEKLYSLALDFTRWCKNKLEVRWFDLFRFVLKFIYESNNEWIIKIVSHLPTLLVIKINVAQICSRHGVVCRRMRLPFVNSEFINITTRSYLYIFKYVIYTNILDCLFTIFGLYIESLHLVVVFIFTRYSLNFLVEELKNPSRY